jgi:hypothetical protein
MTQPTIDLTAPPSRADKALARVGGMAGSLGVALAVLGFIVIGLGWNGAAERITLVQQLPYLLSGGFFGLGLVVLGAAVLVADSHRRDRAELAVRLEALIDATAKAATVVVEAGAPHLSTAADGFAPLPRVAAR